jgi:hypothetical protein
MFLNYTISAKISPSDEKYSLNISLPLHINKFKNLSVISDNFSINLGDFPNNLYRMNEPILLDVYNSDYRGTFLFIFDNDFIKIIDIDCDDYYKLEEAEIKIENNELILEDEDNIVFFEYENNIDVYYNKSKIQLPKVLNKIMIAYINDGNVYKYVVKNISNNRSNVKYEVEDKTNKIEWE